MTISRQNKELGYRVFALIVLIVSIMFIYTSYITTKHKLIHAIEIKQKNNILNEHIEESKFLKTEIANLSSQNKMILSNDANKREMYKKINTILKKLKSFDVKISKINYFKDYNNLLKVELELKPKDTLLPLNISMLKFKRVLEIPSISKILKPKNGYMIKNNKIIFIHYKKPNPKGIK